MAKKKKPAEYYFGKFLNALRDEDAEVNIFGNSYSSNNKNLTIKSLVQELCEFDSPYKINTILRKGEPKEANSSVGKVTENQKKVLKQLDYYFTGPNKSRLNKFYIKNQGVFRFPYPRLQNEISKSVISIINNNSLSEIYAEAFCFDITDDGPFNNLSKRLFSLDVVDSDSTFFKINILHAPKELEECIGLYEKQVNMLEEEDRLASSNFNPFLDFGVSKIVGKNDKLYDIAKLEDAENTLDEFTHKRINFNEKDLKGVALEDWPRYTIEIVIILMLEFTVMIHKVSEKILRDISHNIKYRMFTSKNSGEIDIHNDFESLKSLTHNLIKYRFPNGIEEAIEFKRGNIINDSFFKSPNDFTAKNKPSHKYIASFIKERLAKEMIDKVCSSIEVSEVAYGAIKSTVLSALQ